MALPTALFAMIAAMALAIAAVMSSIDAQQGTARDHDSKEAIAAADAGAGVALLRLNRFQDSLSLASPCVGPAGEAQTPSGGWCPATSAETVGDATFSYTISAFNGTGALKVVAVGTSGAVSRRVEVGLFSYNKKNVFADEKMIGQDNIHMEGTPDIRTDIGTNGSIESEGSGTICGSVRHGVGKEAPEPDCNGETSEGDKDLPEVAPPENIATVNSNCRLAVTCNPVTEVDTYATSNEKKEKRTSTNPWDATHRTINIAQNAKLSMGGQDYFVCGLFINNGELIMLAGANVRIFIDTPEDCGLEPGAVQVEITGNANVVSTGYNPAQGTYEVPGIYVLGESTVRLLGNSGTNELLLYAPHSKIEIGGSATWKGMFAGNTVRMHGTPRIESDPNIHEPDIPLNPLLQRTRYVECTSATASPPDASC
jgi:hypothetical protein